MNPAETGREVLLWDQPLLIQAVGVSEGEVSSAEGQVPDLEVGTYRASWSNRPRSAGSASAVLIGPARDRAAT
jgi:hypothetical protein